MIIDAQTLAEVQHLADAGDVLAKIALQGYHASAMAPENKTGSAQAVVLDQNAKTTFLTYGGNGTETFILQDGTYIGQRRNITAYGGYDTPNTKIAWIQADHFDLPNGNTIQLMSFNDGVELEWNGSAWRIILIAGTNASVQGIG